MSIAVTLFLASVGLITYCYVGYPLVLWLMTRLRRNRPTGAAPALPQDPQQVPFVSLVIAAYREESVILQRIFNALLTDYPADRFEVIIGCDGNEDLTGDLVRTVEDSRVRLMQFEHRRGKPSVLNDCVEAARGDIVVFSDANTFYEPRAIRRLVRHFVDPTVGGVCGQLKLIDPETGNNVDGMYWKYENFLKKAEGEWGALLGANGAIYALRRSLWKPIPPHALIDDFLIGMRIHMSGHRLLFDAEAVATEEAAPNMGDEFHRRTRIGAGGFQSLTWLWPLLNPAYGRVAFAFWSHKVLRWFCPFSMAVALAANVFLLHEPVFQAMFVLQLLLYSAALIGRRTAGRGIAARSLRLVSMFVDMNVALLCGFWRWLRAPQGGTWKRTARTAETQSTKKTPEAAGAGSEDLPVSSAG